MSSSLRKQVQTQIDQLTFAVKAFRDTANIVVPDDFTNQPEFKREIAVIDQYSDDDLRKYVRTIINKCLGMHAQYTRLQAFYDDHKGRLKQVADMVAGMPSKDGAAEAELDELKEQLTAPFICPFR